MKNPNPFFSPSKKSPVNEHTSREGGEVCCKPRRNDGRIRTRTQIHGSLESDFASPPLDAPIVAVLSGRVQVIHVLPTDRDPVRHNHRIYRTKVCGFKQAGTQCVKTPEGKGVGKKDVLGPANSTRVTKIQSYGEDICRDIHVCGGYWRIGSPGDYCCTCV